VEIEISHCGICGSDIHTLTSGWGETKYPQIVGHEIVGKVSKVGPEVKELKVGDRVGVGAQCWSCRKGDCDACGQNKQNICAKVQGTYDGFYDDGQQTQGGYAKHIRVCETFAFKLPDALESEVVGPLMCAGVTVYAPLVRAGTKKGVKVGVIGIGGLGHLGLQFAAALGADVTAISHSARKKDDALKMGASHFIETANEKQVAEAARRFDVLLCTANGSGNNYKEWISMLAPRGRFIMVGMPDGLTLPLPIANIASVEGEYISSMVGSPHVIKEMLEFAAKHNVKPWIEKMPMSEAAKGIEKVRANNVRYRVVLCN